MKLARQACGQLHLILLLLTAVVEILGTTRIWSAVVAVGGSLVAFNSHVLLDKLDRPAHGHICLTQVLLLLLVGLLNGNGPLFHLALCAAPFWLVRKELKWWHTISLQTAETAVVMGLQLGHLLPGQANASGIVCMAVCYVTIGLVVPAAAYNGDVPWRDLLTSTTGQLARKGTQLALPGATPEHSTEQQQRPQPSGLRPPSAAAAFSLPARWLRHVHFTSGGCHDAQGDVVDSPSSCVDLPPCDDLLQLLRDLVAAGMLNPFVVHKHMELAMKRGPDVVGSSFTRPYSSSLDLSTSSRSPSTRPSTSFSSNSVVYDPTSASFQLGAQLAPRSSCELCPTPQDPRSHSQQLPFTAAATSPSQPLLCTRPSLPRACGLRTKSTQTESVALLLPFSRQRPVRSRTQGSLAPEREELPPIVETPHEDIQQQQQQQRRSHNKPQKQAQVKHRTWPPTRSIQTAEPLGQKASQKAHIASHRSHPDDDEAHKEANESGQWGGSGSKSTQWQRQSTGSRSSLVTAASLQEFLHGRKSRSCDITYQRDRVSQDGGIASAPSSSPSSLDAAVCAAVLGPAFPSLPVEQPSSPPLQQGLVSESQQGQQPDIRVAASEGKDGGASSATGLGAVSSQGSLTVHCSSSPTAALTSSQTASEQNIFKQAGPQKQQSRQPSPQSSPSLSRTPPCSLSDLLAERKGPSSVVSSAVLQLLAPCNSSSSGDGSAAAAAGSPKETHMKRQQAAAELYAADEETSNPFGVRQQRQGLPRPSEIGSDGFEGSHNHSQVPLHEISMGAWLDKQVLLSVDIHRERDAEAASTHHANANKHTSTSHCPAAISLPRAASSASEAPSSLQSQLPSSLAALSLVTSPFKPGHQDVAMASNKGVGSEPQWVDNSKLASGKASTRAARHQPQQQHNAQGVPTAPAEVDDGRAVSLSMARSPSFCFDHRPRISALQSPTCPKVPLQYCLHTQGNSSAPASASAAATALLGGLHSKHSLSFDKGRPTRSACTTRPSSFEQTREDENSPILHRGSLDQAQRAQRRGSSRTVYRVSCTFCSSGRHSQARSPKLAPGPSHSVNGNCTLSGQSSLLCTLHQHQQQHERHHVDQRLHSHPLSCSSSFSQLTQPPSANPQHTLTYSLPFPEHQSQSGAPAAATAGSALHKNLDLHPSNPCTAHALPHAPQPDLCRRPQANLGQCAPSFHGTPSTSCTIRTNVQESWQEHGLDTANVIFPSTSMPRSTSSLLKHALPDSMLLSLQKQALPAKTAEQQQATQMGCSKKIRPAGESTELDVENTILANRRYLDASEVLLGEVKVNKVLGFGSMGMVYFGVLWDTKVVVKMIEHGAGILGKEQNRGKLARTEAVLSRMLLHPNVVITYDCCTGMMDATRLQVSGNPPSRALRAKAGRLRKMTVMVQEYCDAGTLSDALQKQKHGLDRADPGFPDLVLQLALDIANGIKYMHSLRVLHVDLKAENILLTRSNSGTAPAHARLGQLTAKVADLGLALVLPVDQDETQSGIHGTVSHMPPEAMRGTSFSMATDIYSLGVVFWEMMTQGKPFAGMVAHQVVEAVCIFHERPEWPADLDPKFAGLKDVAIHCWDAQPSNRPSIFEVVTRLHEIIDPSLAIQHSEGTRSMASEESDELEMALKSQYKALAPTLQLRGSSHTVEQASTCANERLGGMRSSKDMLVSEADGEPLKTRGRSSIGHRSNSFGKRASSNSGGALHKEPEIQRPGMGLQAIMAAGPPQDRLSRMLYYLAQVPPLPEQLQRVEIGGGIVRLAVAVDMSGTSVGTKVH